MVVQTQRVLASATLQPNRQYNNSSPLIRNEEHICWKKHLKITRWRFTMGDIPPGRHHFTQWNAGPHLGCASHSVSGYFNHKNMWGYWYPMISYQHLSESINQWVIPLLINHLHPLVSDLLPSRKLTLSQGPQTWSGPHRPLRKDHVEGHPEETLGVWEKTDVQIVDRSL
jgi:hypothetical protein